MATFSNNHLTARRWFMDRLAEAGLDASMDGIGNVYRIAPGDGPAVLTGSYFERQNHAGWLDGALDMVYGLEAARAVGRGIDVAA